MPKILKIASPVFFLLQKTHVNICEQNFRVKVFLTYMHIYKICECAHTYTHTYMYTYTYACEG